nr:hypothetical protein [uncultured Brevundimonas sp.]
MVILDLKEAHLKLSAPERFHAKNPRRRTAAGSVRTQPRIMRANPSDQASTNLLTDFQSYALRFVRRLPTASALLSVSEF